MLLVCRRDLFSCPLEVPGHMSAEQGKGKGRDEELCLSKVALSGSAVRSWG